jgi:SchA/CurD like domain
MNRYALSFTVKPGTEPQVAELLRTYRRPPAAATPGGPPLLHRTSVFMVGQRVVRVIDVSGSLGTVMRHLAAQPQIRAVEAALDPFLSSPRDLTSPEGVRAFLHSALLPPTGPSGDAPAAQPRQRCGLLFPVRPGRGEQAARLLARAGLTTTFRRGDVLVGLLEVDGDASGARDRWAREVSATAGTTALAGVVQTREDLTTDRGFRRFVADCQMELLTDRGVNR